MLIVAQLDLRLAPTFYLIFGPPFPFFLLFILGKQFLNQIDVEFDFSIGHAIVPFFVMFFLIIIKQCTVDHVCPPVLPEIHIPYRFILDIKHYFHKIL